MRVRAFTTGMNAPTRLSSGSEPVVEATIATTPSARSSTRIRRARVIARQSARRLARLSCRLVFFLRAGDDEPPLEADEGPRREERLELCRSHHALSIVEAPASPHHRKWVTGRASPTPYGRAGFCSLPTVAVLIPSSLG